jgi:hypothetical protein
MKTAEVTAVHEDDAIAVLELLGVADAYREGELLCSVCELPLRDNGLGAARGGLDGSYVFACARPDCLDEFHRGESAG